MPHKSMYVYPRLPGRGYGLGNMMFVWGRALIAAKTLALPILAPIWTHWFRIGPWLRGERYKRHYIGEFSNDGYIKGPAKYRILATSHLVSEENIATNPDSFHSQVLLFEGMKGGFSPLISHREIIANELLRIVDHRVRSAVMTYKPSDYIAVHIRRSDFVQLGQAIPLEWYIKASIEVRSEFKRSYPILVFSDSDPEELSPLSWPKGTIIMPTAPAVQDILMLANAQVLIGTSLSTFSLWGSFLSGKTTVWPPVSPGVFGYGLHTENHIGTDWEGRLDRSVNFY